MFPMRRFLSLSLSLSLAMATAVGSAALHAQAPASAATAATVSASDAKPFLGDWNVVGESPMGPFTTAVSVKVEAAKVVASVSSDIQPLTPISEISKSGESLILAYSFTYEGNAIPALLTLTPKADKLDASFDFAAGAFVMTGVGTKAAAPAAN
jgi:hypothetical protein